MANNFSDSLPVKIGSGATYVTSTVRGIKNALDVNVSNSPIVGTPILANVSMPIANTEYEYSVHVNAKQLLFKTRENSTLKFCFTKNESSTNYITVPPGTSYTLSGIDASDTLMLFFQANRADETLEIISWI